jgi:hypothetical protein
MKLAGRAPFGLWLQPVCFHRLSSIHPCLISVNTFFVFSFFLFLLAWNIGFDSINKSKISQTF